MGGKVYMVQTRGMHERQTVFVNIFFSFPSFVLGFSWEIGWARYLQLTGGFRV